MARASSGRVCVAPNSRNNIWTASFPELAGQRFATFLESINSADPSCAAVANTGFVAERAVYSGAGFLAGHVNGGTRWTGTIATPPVAPAFGVTSVSPSSGRLGGGQTITITGAGFQQGAKVYFDNLDVDRRSQRQYQARRRRPGDRRRGLAGRHDHHGQDAAA